jgi:hypothetical protein
LTREYSPSCWISLSQKNFLASSSKFSTLCHY